MKNKRKYTNMSENTLAISKYKLEKNRLCHRMKSTRTVENDICWFNINWGERTAIGRRFLDHRSPLRSAHISRKISQGHHCRRSSLQSTKDSKQPPPRNDNMKAEQSQYEDLGGEWLGFSDAYKSKRAWLGAAGTLHTCHFTCWSWWAQCR